MPGVQIDYTSLDYDELKADLRRFALAETGWDLSNLPPTDFGAVLLGSLAYVGDLLGYTANRLVAESFALLALRKANFLNAARAVGYSMHGPVGAELTLSLEVDLGAGPPATATITPHDKFSTADGVVFQPTGTTSVGPGTGTSTISISAEEGDESVDEPLGTGDGSAMQRFSLAGHPIIESSLSVEVNGAVWTRAENDVVALAGPSDEVYGLRWGTNGEVFIQFGDGVNGAVVPATNPVTATYKVGTGYRGNVDVGAVTRLTSTDPLVVSVTNTTRGVYGSPEQSLSSAQAALPGFVRANDRAVSEVDYGPVLVREVPGIVRARGAPGIGRDVIVYCCPAGGSSGSLNPTLIAAARSALRDKKMTGRRIVLREAVYVDVAITVDVHVLPVAGAEDTTTRVSNVIADAHDSDSLDFGVTLAVQVLSESITPARVRGVDRCLIRRYTVLPYMGLYRLETPTGNGVATHYVTSPTIGRREWRIDVTSAGTPSTRGSFTVTERRVGVVSELSSVTMQDESALFTESNGLALSSTPYWYLRLNPYDTGSSQRRVVGNTDTTVTVEAGSDLRTVAQEGDEYVVERLSTVTGVVYRDTIVGVTAALAATLALPGTWVTGDEVRVSDGTTVFRTQITGGTAGAYTVADAIPALLAGAVADAVWVSPDGTFEFVLPRGTVNYAAGDAFYVDTFPVYGDIKLRDTTYPQLDEENLVLRPIGGRA